MSETILCPICETENAATATHCEVCGERLVPAGPGEELDAAENVAAEIQSEGEVVGFQVEESEPDDTGEGITAAPADTTADFDTSAFAGDDDSEEELPEMGEISAADDTADELEPQPTTQPGILYSPIDGSAYEEGTPEYEEGFGPHGEELVAEPPETQTHVSDAAADEAPQGDEDEDEDYEVSLDEGGFDEAEYEHARAAEEEELAASPSVEEGRDDEFAAEVAGARRRNEPSAEFRAAFQVRSKERSHLQPLPQPGVYADPATLTVYVNRQPVARHAIETDEVLIGRRDPVADAYPDLDLTEFDPDAHVSRKHAYVYRQNKNYTLYAVSNAGTQLNSELLDLGDKRPLKHGDVIVVAGKIAMKFDVPEA